MKVAFVNQPWDTVTPPVSSGSIPIWTYETARVLSQDLNYEITIYARRSEQQPAREVAERIEYRRVSTVGMKLCNGLVKSAAKLFPTFRYLNSWLYSLPYALRIAIDLRRQQADLVHIHNFSQFVPIIKAINPQIKIVLHMHCEWLSQFDRKAIAKRLSKTDLIVGCSDYITNKIKAQFPNLAHQCQRVFNGVDVSQFKPTTTDDKAKKTVKVLFVGRISPEKGLHTLIEAFSQLVAKIPDAQLYLVGPNKQASSEFIADLSDDPQIRALAAFDSLDYSQYLKEQLTPELASRVFFTGAVSHQALHRHFQSADILVNPSLSEAFGMSLIEAMATGIPTVATQIGGMTDIVRSPETGLLISPEHPEELAQAMAQLLTDDELRAQMGQAARARAVDVFAWDAIAASLKNHYSQLATAAAYSDKLASANQMPATLIANHPAISQPQPKGN